MSETNHKSRAVGVVGGVAAVTGIALQVKPDEAVSNLSLWLQFFGIDRVPNFLTTTQADTWGTAIGLSIAAFSFSIWAYRRLKSAKADTESGFRKSESVSKIDRISIFQLRELAKKAGWPTNPDDAEWINFALVLRQALVDGNMKAWGRKNISTVDDLVAAEPLVLIPPSHWAEFQIDVISLRNASQSIDVHTYNQNVSGWALRQGYRDLHVSENEARAVISEFGIFHSARIMAEAATTIAENAKDEKRTRARDRMRRIAEGRE